VQILLQPLLLDFIHRASSPPPATTTGLSRCLPPSTMRRGSLSPSRSPSPLFDTLPNSRNSSISSEYAEAHARKLQPPRRLSQPAHLQHGLQNLRLGGELAEIPLGYLHETLSRLGESSMLQVKLQFVADHQLQGHHFSRPAIRPHPSYPSKATCRVAFLAPSPLTSHHRPIF
jgi:hypothetical protein